MVCIRFSHLLQYSVALFLAAPVAHAQVYKTLYAFSGGNDGAQPLGSLIQAPGGMLYGVTKVGGIGFDLSGKGVIFSFDRATGTQTVLHTFTGSPNDGSAPYGSLLWLNGGLYGMTNTGGTNPASGIIFSLNVATSSFSLLHPFADSPDDGAAPQGSLITAGASFYGMTAAGGSSGNGSLFSFNPATSGLNLLHSFSGMPGDGKFPQGSLVQSGNTLFGMSQLGGSANLGALFAFDLSSNKQTLLHSFTGGITDGASPHGSLIQSGNLLYGMTHDGGNSNLGTIFSYNLATGVETILHSFAGGIADGANPDGSLIQSGNILYGI